MNIANWLHDTQRRDPQRPALFDGSRQVADYATFTAHVRQRAAQLLLGLLDGVSQQARVDLGFELVVRESS